MPRLASYCYDAGGNGKVHDDSETLGLDVGQGSDCWACGWFLSVDPLVRKNPHQSPYAFADNSPISKIDFMGGDGIIYLVILPGTNVDAATLLQNANDMAKRIGLNTKVVLFKPSTSDALNEKFIDYTDRYVVIGNSANHVKKYFKENDLDESSIQEFFDKPKVLGETDMRQMAALKVSAAVSRVDEARETQANREEMGMEDTWRAPTVEEVLAAGALHESGHSITRIKHNDGQYEDIGLMRDGLWINGFESIFTPKNNVEIVRKWNAPMSNPPVIDPINPGYESNYNTQRTPTDNYDKNAEENDRP